MPSSALHCARKLEVPTANEFALADMGGMLYVMAFGTGPLSLDARSKS